MLYAWFIDALFKKLEEQATFEMGGLPISAFFYADDIAIICDSKKHAMSILQHCERFAVDHGFRFAPTKYEYLTLSLTHLDLVLHR